MISSVRSWYEQTRFSLWVKLVVDELLRGLRRKESSERLRQRLLESSTNLNTLYQRIIDGIPGGGQEEVERRLYIVICVVEP